ncbi:L,D-transpeptidase [Brevibacillus fluminis]|uniref:L,D-transpeptidase n=1 Tax=Brevibacillus fluminis TaxID=511487 RepID=A0A3M8DH13_9BACL|nr:L,D-transpeptidase [Brevibacillus fluminis]RNB87390.1 L,D-transpeptidase [Brevibacillus fluminis]
MTKTDFLQAKATYLIANPTADEFTFYTHFVTAHPTLAIGWLMLGRELEKRGEPDKAFDAYRRAMHSRERNSFSEEARDAYQTMLRKRKEKRRSAWVWLRRGLLTLFTLLAVVLLPAANRSGEATPSLPATSSVEQAPVKKTSLRHTEVIAVSGSVSNDQLAEQMKRYLQSRRTYYDHPYTVIAVPEEEGVPLYTPLLFYQPQRMRGIVTYDPSSDTITAEKWFHAACDCGDDPLAASARKAYHEERVALEETLTLRNALYRTYQRTGKLPERLDDLARPYPANSLPAIPQLLVPPKQLGGGASQGALPGEARYIDFPYHPDALVGDNVWKSMSAVLPLPFYPEPAIPLEPMQLFVQQKMFKLQVMSGPHLVRQYPIGIGREERTPEGYFSILQKISQPGSATNAYGTRGMVFTSANHAIHGTNKPESIGHDVSLGCIRLHNADVEELYSFASPGTEVIISDQPKPQLNWKNPFRFYLPTDADEETPGIVYHWLN